MYNAVFHILGILMLVKCHLDEQSNGRTIVVTFFVFLGVMRKKRIIRYSSNETNIN